MTDTFPWDEPRAALLSGALNGYYGWAGMQVLEVSEGRSLISMRPRAEMLTAWRSLNGGVMNGLVELPSFVALLTALTAEELPVTNDIFVQHLSRLPGDAEYLFEGRLLRRSRRMAWTEVFVRVAGEIVSTARITKTIVPRP